MSILLYLITSSSPTLCSTYILILPLFIVLPAFTRLVRLFYVLLICSARWLLCWIDATTLPLPPHSTYLTYHRLYYLLRCYSLPTTTLYSYAIVPTIDLVMPYDSCYLLGGCCCYRLFPIPRSD